MAVKRNPDNDKMAIVDIGDHELRMVATNSDGMLYMSLRRKGTYHWVTVSYTDLIAALKIVVGLDEENNG